MAHLMEGGGTRETRRRETPKLPHGWGTSGNGVQGPTAEVQKQVICETPLAELAPDLGQVQMISSSLWEGATAGHGASRSTRWGEEEALPRKVLEGSGTWPHVHGGEVLGGSGGGGEIMERLQSKSLSDA